MLCCTGTTNPSRSTHAGVGATPLRAEKLLPVVDGYRYVLAHIKCIFSLLFYDAHISDLPNATRGVV